VGHLEPTGCAKKPPSAWVLFGKGRQPRLATPGVRQPRPPLRPAPPKASRLYAGLQVVEPAHLNVPAGAFPIKKLCMIPTRAATEVICGQGPAPGRKATILAFTRARGWRWCPVTGLFAGGPGRSRTLSKSWMAAAAWPRFNTGTRRFFCGRREGSGTRKIASAAQRHPLGERAGQATIQIVRKKLVKKHWGPTSAARGTAKQ